MVTLKDVSRVCGRPVSTVSNVLSCPDNNRYSAETCRVVTDAARQLGYVRSRLTDGFLRGKSGFVGVLHNPVYTSNRLLSVLFRETQSRGLNLLVDVLSVYDEAHGREAVEGLLSSRCEALILSLPNADKYVSKDTAELCRKQGVPIVAIGDCRPFTSVGTDRIEVFKQSTRHLLAGNPKSIRCILPQHVDLTNDRVTGFKAGLEEAGIPFNAGLLIYLPDPVYGEHPDYLGTAHRIAYEWARENAGSVEGTAFLTYSDAFGCGLINGFKDAGLRIPEHVQLIGYDDHEICRVVQPTLSSVRPDFTAQARKALDLCVPGDGRSTHVGVPAKFVFRESTKSAASCGVDEVSQDQQPTKE